MGRLLHRSTLVGMEHRNVLLEMSVDQQRIREEECPLVMDAVDPARAIGAFNHAASDLDHGRAACLIAFIRALPKHFPCLAEACASEAGNASSPSSSRRSSRPRASRSSRTGAERRREGPFAGMRLALSHANDEIINVSMKLHTSCPIVHAGIKARFREIIQSSQNKALCVAFIQTYQYGSVK